MEYYAAVKKDVLKDYLMAAKPTWGVGNAQHTHPHPHRAADALTQGTCTACQPAIPSQRLRAEHPLCLRRGCSDVQDSPALLSWALSKVGT